MFAPLWQPPLPPLPVGGGVNWESILLNMLFAVLWTVVAVIAFAIAMPLALRLFSVLTPGFNEFEQLKNGNMAVSLLMSTFVLAATVLIVAVLLK
jgi:uncharacterized membrane protein YjfL (UPF0719 family)